MLLEHLYRISLEEPRLWAMYIGLSASTMTLLDIRIDLVGSYISGYRASQENDVETRAFFDWLRDVKSEFPTQGWITKYLEDCNGDHIAAIKKFCGFLHEYLLQTRPDWLLALNAEPIPSGIRNGLGTPASPDIRDRSHMAILGID